jgi:hypothetical protein
MADVVQERRDSRLDPPGKKGSSVRRTTIRGLAVATGAMEVPMSNNVSLGE